MIVIVLLRLTDTGLKVEVAIGLIAPLEIVEGVDNVGVTECATSVPAKKYAVKSREMKNANIPVNKFEITSSDIENARFFFPIFVFIVRLLSS